VDPELALAVNSAKHQTELPMNCPRCANTPLEQEINAGMEVDRCPACGGLWLDTGEGELISRPGEIPAAVIEQVAALDTHRAVDGSETLTCPRCANGMQREHYAESSIEIDRCVCGVWLDAGELEKIGAYRSKALEGLSRQKAAEADDDGLDFDFSSASLERAFARIYFDVGKDLPQE